MTKSFIKHASSPLGTCKIKAHIGQIGPSSKSDYKLLFAHDAHLMLVKCTALHLFYPVKF